MELAPSAFAETLLRVVPALLCGVFVNAGMSKLIAPERAALAVAAALRLRLRTVSAVLIRTVAAAEIVVAIGLAVDPVVLPARAAACGLGLTFVVFGILGVTAATKVSCGCFGSWSERPLGLANVGFGAAIAAAAVAIPSSLHVTAGELLVQAAIASMTLAMLPEISRRVRNFVFKGGHPIGRPA